MQKAMTDMNTNCLGTSDFDHIKIFLLSQYIRTIARLSSRFSNQSANQVQSSQTSRSQCNFFVIRIY